MGTKSYLGAICVCLTVTSLSVHAASINWIDNAGGTFTDAANWSSTVPGSADIAIYDLASTYTVYFSAGATNQKALIRNDDVTFNLGGQTYSLLSTAFPQASLTVGELNADVGQLTITNGTVSTYHTLMGDQAGSTGTLNISTGGALSAAGVVRVGENGDGNLNITNGGTLSNNSTSIIGRANGATGNATVDGTGSSWSTRETFIGYDSGSTGSLTVQSGASMTTNGISFIGYNTGSIGTAVVDGAGSSWHTSGEMRIGNSGTGALTVSNGASISNNGRVIIGTGSSASGTVTIDDANWTNNNELNVGWSGNGVMNINNGGMVSNSNGAIARNSGSTGTVNVDGTGSSWTNSQDVSIGGSYQDIINGGNNSNGNGTLNISNGAVVSAGRYGFIGTSTNSTGAMTVDGSGSSFSSQNNLFVGYYGTGNLDVTNGGTVSSPAGYIGILATASNNSNATISGAGSTWTTSRFLELRYGSLDIKNGGSVITQDYGVLNTTLAAVTVDGAGSIWDVSSYLISHGQLNISNGGGISTGDQVTLYGGSSTTVSGAGSSLDIGTYLSSNSQLNISDGGMVSTGVNATLNSGSSTMIDGTGSLLDITTTLDAVNGGTLIIFNGGAASATDNWIRNGSVVSVAGAGAALNSSDSIYVGGYDTASYGSGVLNLNTGGIANAGDTLKIWSPGTVNLNGGTINTNTLDIAGGAFNFYAGTLNFTADFVLGAAGPLGSAYSLNSLQNLGVTDTATIDATSILTLDGGTFSVGTLANNGIFQFNSGTFNLTDSNMSIGAGGLLGSNVQLDSGQTVNVSNTTTINSGSVLTLNDGAFSSGSMTNNGDIVLNGSSSRLGGALSNNALVKGSGRVEAQVSNNAGAQIRVASGESMRFTSAGNSNAGRIEVIGGEIEFDQNLVNQGATGNIVARDAKLRFNGGLDNEGSMGLSFGTTDVFGDIDNTGSVVITGNSNATFYDDYINNGITTTSIGSNAVFFGSVSGSGSYIGGGTLFFEGDLAPGNSPALVTVDGNMNLGFGLTTTMELTGTTRGSEYDAFDITGNLNLGGMLDVDLLNIFTPTNGDFFDLFIADSISGGFSELLFPELSGNLVWDLIVLENFYGDDDVLRLYASTVPVPAAVWLFGSGLISLIGLARRRANA